MSFDVEVFTLKKRLIIKYVRRTTKGAWTFNIDTNEYIPALES